ncbi:MAG: hypothetical protein RR646_02160 [Erysipelotrichaceae bacterium]
MKKANSKCPSCGHKFNVGIFPLGFTYTCPKCRKELVLEPKYYKKYLILDILWIVAMLLTIIIINLIVPASPIIVVVILFFAIVPRFLFSSLGTTLDLYHYKIDESKPEWHYDGEGNYYNEQGEKEDFIIEEPINKEK